MSPPDQDTDRHRNLAAHSICLSPACSLHRPNSRPLRSVQPSLRAELRWQAVLTSRAQMLPDTLTGPTSASYVILSSTCCPHLPASCLPLFLSARADALGSTGTPGHVIFQARESDQDPWLCSATLASLGQSASQAGWSTSLAGRVCSGLQSSPEAASWAHALLWRVTKTKTPRQSQFSQKCSEP